MSKQSQPSQLKIDRLVLRGFSQTDALRVRDAFTTTLQQHFDRHIATGTPIISRQEEHRTLPSLAASNPYTIGRLAAESLLGSLKDE